MAGRVARSSALAIAVALGIACDPADWTLGGARHFGELAATDAVQQVARGDAWLLQVRSQGGEDPRASGAEVVTPVQPLPARGVARERAVLVIGHDDAAARRFASRLVRAGFARVFVIRGGIQSWLEATIPTPSHDPGTSGWKG